MSARSQAKRKLTPAQRRARLRLRRAAWIAGIVAVAAGSMVADRMGVFGHAPVADIDKYDGHSGRVVHVVDGDTIDLDIRDRKYPHTRVRLWGVDTPETVKENTPVQHFGPEATAFTREAVGGETVRLQLDPRQTRDRYGRLLAYVYGPDGRMLNRELIRRGYAYADPRYDHAQKREFLRLQRLAKQAGRGLWEEVTRDDLPYYYRRSLELPADR